ncbi:MAG: TonB-dependent receptor [Hyphomonadaceae bacterium]|nr:TonB-dependent receptor [Hyphomonadaceae bacterium]
MKTAIRGASRAALILGLAGSFQGAWAQQGAAPQPQTPASQAVATTQAAPQAQAPQAGADQTSPATPADSGEKVVIVGSLIATTAEDAAKPVEVYTAETLREQGSPSVAEFVKSLTVNYGADLGFGNTSQDIPTGAGFANADLRGIGPNGTLVLMNGRRLASTNGGFGADLNTIPMEALEQVEVLKDGASTTYGAGAVGGVLNFRTRRDIDAPIVTVERSMYDGSEGEWNADFQTGWVGDAGNVLLSLHYGHVDRMSQLKRDFSTQPFAVNPTLYSLNGPNPGRFHASQNFYTANSLTPGAGLVTAGATGAVNDLPGSVGAAATQACQQVGGEIVANLNGSPTTTSTNTACALKQFYFQDLISANDSYRAYLEVNTDLLETMEFHMDVTYSKSDTLRHDIPTAAPLAGMRSTAAGVGANCASSCQYVIPVNQQIYSLTGTGTGTFVRNPFVDDFMARTGVTAGQVAGNGAIYTANNWRPFGYGGNPLYESRLRESHQQRERFLASVGFTGEFDSDTLLGSVLGGIKYDYSGQYNAYTDTNIAPDVVVSRLQAALMGYGGFNCAAIDRVATDFTSDFTFNRTVGIQSNIAPGTNGCQYFNPFSSGWATSFATGAANPMFNAGTPVLPASATPRPTGYENPVDLINWMIADRVTETQLLSTTFDATWSGEIPAFELPGGVIGWAAGVQWRMTERRNLSSTGQSTDERNLNFALCPYPDQLSGFRGCAGTPGAFFSADEHVESDEDSQTIAYYAEIAVPVLDNLNLGASVRREEYNGGRIIGDIWGVNGKYDITDNLYVRASYGTNFRAEQALDNDPGLITVATDPSTRFGATNVGRVTAVTLVDPDLGIEDDTTFNAGIGYNMDIGDGRLRLSADFFEIVIDGEVTTTATATVFNNVFGINSDSAVITNSQKNRTNPAIPDAAGPAQASTLNQFADCSARLAFMVAFTTPTCITGVTTAADLVAVARSTQNGPRRTLNGVDYAVDFSYPILNGTFGVNFTATNNLVYKTQGFEVAGIRFEDPQVRLGFVNGSLTVPLVPDWRSNLTVRWANEQHNINLRMNYQSGVHDERDPAFQGTLTYPTAGTLTAINPAGGTSTFGIFPEDYTDFDLTYIYSAPFWEELDLRLTILNITDEDPLAAQNRNGYLTGIGNPRGRQVELGVTKRF